MNLRKHSTKFLTVLGVAGFIGTVVMAVNATPKCEQLLDEAEARLKESDDDAKLSKKESAVCFFKAYWPTIAMGITSVGCFIASNYICGKREAVAIAAFGAAETSLKYFHDAALETVGEKTMDEIHAKVADRHLRDHPIPEEKEAISEGKTLCYDCYTGRTFESDMQTIREVVNNLNERMLSGDFVSLNDFYFSIGLEEVKRGDELGWHPYDGGDKLEVRYSSRLTKTGKPCLVIDYDVEPAYFDSNFI